MHPGTEMGNVTDAIHQCGHQYSFKQCVLRQIQKTSVKKLFTGDIDCKQHNEGTFKYIRRNVFKH